MPTAQAMPQPPPYHDLFVGPWRNQNPHTDGITRVVLSARLGTLYVHLWGKCVPNDCDLGRHKVALTDPDRPSFAFGDEHISEQGQLSLLPEGKLQLVLSTRFHDASGRPDYTSVYRFIRDGERSVTPTG